METSNVVATQSTETETIHPLRAAIEAAEAAHEATRATVDALENDDSIDSDDPRWIAACAAEQVADDALGEARAAIEGSDCPRLWDLSEEGHVYDSVIATSVEEALEEARDRFDRGNYNDPEGTMWIDVRVHCRETDERGKDTIQSDEEEPECSDDDGAHDWQSPIELVGGIKENPGVWGKGGGVIITEVCMCCGCKRTTDTWAQRPDTGEQGLTSVSYETDAFSAEELAQVQS